MITDVLNPQIIKEAQTILDEMTPRKLFEMGPVEKLQFHMSLVQLEYFGVIKCVGEVLKKLETTRVEYHYEVSDEQGKRLVENKEILCEIYGKDNINKFWVDYKKGKINAEVRRIKAVRYYSPQNDILLEEFHK